MLCSHHHQAGHSRGGIAIRTQQGWVSLVGPDGRPQLELADHPAANANNNSNNPCAHTTCFRRPPPTHPFAYRRPCAPVHRAAGKFLRKLGLGDKENDLPEEALPTPPVLRARRRVLDEAFGRAIVPPKQSKPVETERGSIAAV